MVIWVMFRTIFLKMSLHESIHSSWVDGFAQKQGESNPLQSTPQQFSIHPKVNSPHTLLNRP
ncbi:hypothetical protein GIB67_003712, partial [Kingdonia uniflora]